jgi:hypothetical protein
MVLKALWAFLDAARHLVWTVSVDSTNVRTHRVAAGAEPGEVLGSPSAAAICVSTRRRWSGSTTLRCPIRGVPR